jgi:hypothetical protein
MASFPQASPPTTCAHLSPPPYAPHALPISFVWILPPFTILGKEYRSFSSSLCQKENGIYGVKTIKPRIISIRKYF